MIPSCLKNQYHMGSWHWRSLLPLLPWKKENCWGASGQHLSLGCSVLDILDCPVLRDESCSLHFWMATTFLTSIHQVLALAALPPPAHIYEKCRYTLSNIPGGTKLPQVEYWSHQEVRSLNTEESEGAFLSIALKWSKPEWNLLN